VYLPGLLMLGTWVLLVKAAEPSGMLLLDLDRMQMGYVAAMFLTATFVLWHTYMHARTPILRQQMKWVIRGTFLAVVPFTVFYVIPYLYGRGPTAMMKISVLSLVFLPLTFGYAIVRYRLMDVDLIFKRGMAYTIAAGSIAAMYFAAVGTAAELFHKNFPSMGPGGLVAGSAGPVLPFSWSGVSLHAAGASVLRARLVPAGADGVSLVAVDGADGLVVSVRRLVLRPVPPGGLAGPGAGAGAGLFVQDWGPVPAGAGAEAGTDAGARAGGGVAAG